MVRNSFSRRLRHRLRGTCAISAAKRKVEAVPISENLGRSIMCNYLE